MTRRALLVSMLALAAPPAPAQAELVPGPTRERAHLARVIVATDARRVPWESRSVARLKPQAPWGGGTTQLLVLDSLKLEGRLWLKVQLPVRPNGAAGWIPAAHATVSRTPWRVHVSLRRRAVTVLRHGRVVRRFGAVIGAPGTPTPVGRFAVSEPVPQADPGGFLGPWALHLTAFSDVLDDFGGGPGRIAIHGRSGASLRDPLGTARSHGCVRIDNAQVRFLARVAVPGTPVRISR